MRERGSLSLSIPWKDTISYGTRPPRKMNDETIGEIRLIESDDDRWWESSIDRGDRRIIVKMAGEESPEQLILSKVKSFTSDIDDFLSEVQNFLSVEASKDPNNRDDIMNLTVESVHFFWPDKPSFAEIIFGGASDDLWSCGYDKGMLFNLSVSG